MSGAARVAWPADVAVGPGRDPAVSVLAVATPHAVPRVARPCPTHGGRDAHVTLVMPAPVVLSHSAPAVAGEASGSTGAADAGVC
jgi:hypothetical protein